jgi:hypothetical protein
LDCKIVFCCCFLFNIFQERTPLLRYCQYWNIYMTLDKWITYICELMLPACTTCIPTVYHGCSYLMWTLWWWWRLIGSYTSPYWRSGISSTSVRNSVFSRVERSGTNGKTLNFSHEWKKSQIFNKDECKYLFLPFQLKNKACQCHVYYTKYYNATCNAVNTHLFKTAFNLLGEIS